MHNRTFSKRSLLLALLVVYFIFCSFVFLSLSIPPADFPFCVAMFVVAVWGLFAAAGESRVWRLIWIGALVGAILAGALELISGARIAHQHHAELISPHAVLPVSSPPAPVN
jgi:hypothetical protein